MDVSTPDRARGGKRWTRRDDDRLLELASQGKSWEELASTMQRSYSSVQSRLRTLLNQSDRAKCLLVQSEPRRFPLVDLSCGALSQASHQVLSTLWMNIKGHHSIIRRWEPSLLKPEVECFLGAVIREGLICAVIREGLICLQPDSPSTWRRFSISRIRANDAGVDSGVARNLISALHHHGFLELFVGYVGYSGSFQLDIHTARFGRSALLRATRKTLQACARQGINLNNLHTHLPTLR
ncbi:hypothetical protein ACVIN2_005870 [Bradyrhizobium sp. USDA 3650]